LRPAYWQNGRWKCRTPYGCGGTIAIIRHLAFFVGSRIDKRHLRKVFVSGKLVTLSAAAPGSRSVRSIDEWHLGKRRQKKVCSSEALRLSPAPGGEWDCVQLPVVRGTSVPSLSRRSQ
jgi:hypothetical protein